MKSKLLWKELKAKKDAELVEISPEFWKTRKVDDILLRSHIHEYGHVQNRHVMFITIEHIKNIGISEFENT